MFRYLVLGLLRDGQIRHGYALMKEYRERSGLRVSTGSFYRELQKLVATGLVRTASNPADADPRRAPYEITANGRMEFDRWLAGPTGPSLGRYEDELSSRSLFIVDAEPELASKLLESWKEELWIRSKIYERERAGAWPPPGQPPTFPILSILLARNLKHIAADVEFIDELAAAHREWTLQASAATKARRPHTARSQVEESRPAGSRKARRP